jgi:hypothetical protein
MVAGSSPRPSAYAAGDRLACRAATHRWLSLGVASLAATSLAAMVATSELLAESFAQPASGPLDPPVGPGLPRPRRRRAAGPSPGPSAAVPRRGMAVRPARSWPCGAPRRGRNRWCARLSWTRRRRRRLPHRSGRRRPGRCDPNRTGPPVAGPTASCRNGGSGPPRRLGRTGPGRQTRTTSPVPTGPAGKTPTAGGTGSGAAPSGTGMDGTTGSAGPSRARVIDSAAAGNNSPPEGPSAADGATSRRWHSLW